MRSIASYIRENLDRDISVSDLAALVQMSPSHFARVFKASTGMTPHRFILCERVAQAKELCAATSLSASQVAAEVGFSSHSHFTVRFRNFFGCTPAALRRTGAKDRLAELRKIVTARLH